MPCQSLYFNLDETEIRNICNHQIETLEHWGRRLLDESFRKDYGNNYLDAEITSGQPLVKKVIVDKIRGRVKSDPLRYPREIDAIVIEDLVYFLCREDLYKKYFVNIFEPYFSGIAEIRNVLDKISSIRNKLAHGHTISVHEAEQAVCYSNDFIDCFKMHYQKIGKEQDYNVPIFIEVHDSEGGNYIRKDTKHSWDLWPGHNYSNYPNIGKEIRLRSGDEYKLKVIVDSSFDSSSYRIEWSIDYEFHRAKAGTGSTIEFTATDDMVSRMIELKIKLITNKSWHRFADLGCDD